MLFYVDVCKVRHLKICIRHKNRPNWRVYVLGIKSISTRLQKQKKRKISSFTETGCVPLDRLLFIKNYVYIERERIAIVCGWTIQQNKENFRTEEEKCFDEVTRTRTHSTQSGRRTRYKTEKWNKKRFANETFHCSRRHRRRFFFCYARKMKHKTI